jgi:hypothetical protein
MRAAIVAALAVSSLTFAPAAAAGPTGNMYTIGGGVAIITTWGPADCIHLNWPTSSEPICNTAHTYMGHQYNVQPGQVIGVDPDISGNDFVACSIIDMDTGLIVYQDSGTLGDGHDINCLADTYGRDVEQQAT